MKQVYYWILISLAVGAMAGVITSIFSHRSKKKIVKDNDGTERETTEDEDTLDEIEGTHSANIVFVILVISVLAFIVIWLFMAVNNRHILD